MKRAGRGWGIFFLAAVACFSGLALLFHWPPHTPASSRLCGGRGARPASASSGLAWWRRVAPIASLTASIPPSSSSIFSPICSVSFRSRGCVLFLGFHLPLALFVELPAFVRPLLLRSFLFSLLSRRRGERSRGARWVLGERKGDMRVPFAAPLCVRARGSTYMRAVTRLRQ